WQRRKRTEMMLDGVTLADPASVYFAYDTKIGRDCIIEPHVVFGPGVTIKDKATINAFSHIAGADVEDSVVIGPYARLRPGTKLKKNAKIGNFCEIKKAVIGEGAKVNHLSYIGDAVVGAGSNIGAGTITCNYDGVNKHQTIIGAGVFVGSNTALVAPVKLGDNSYVGSGSVITKDAPAGSLVVSRTRQTTMEGRAKVLKNRALALKAKLKDEKNSTGN
ncbi:MAG: bifunctional UDP-N-acetylglucosamine diphosphorylase/glucosamine-1-phosphate N-acetyltransferase GlmU, partial [Rhizobiaceae bacterium]|nr:bifunctional UDP-N-acetylglucosamine diphosphorylase/glucosamine-1-phosphate N-acetyltransferase GlmU [Rhizobiaceae bacterium]